jgi:hypothetical protein
MEEIVSSPSEYPERSGGGTYPPRELQSPFLEGELFTGEAEGEWESRLPAFLPESPFQLAFEAAPPERLSVEPDRAEQPGFPGEESRGYPGEALAEESEGQEEQPLEELYAAEDRMEELFVEEEAVPAADLRQRIVEIARQEWDRWGRGTKSETDRAMRDTLRGYWEDLGLSRSQADKKIDDGSPWSAAFISWVLRRAGARDAFSYSPAHYAYVAAAKRSREKGESSKFWAYRITEVKPEVGDLVCRDREARGAGGCGGTTYDNVADGRYRPTHSDIITEVGPRSITVIGGNVGGKACAKGAGCTVNSKVLKLDDRGFVIPGQSRCKYFAIVKPPGHVSPGPAPSGALGSVLSLPQKIAEAVRTGFLTLEVAAALLSGERDVSRLTDRVFYARHPERDPKRGGSSIQPHERQLVQEWVDIRDRLIRPALRLLAIEREATAPASHEYEESRHFVEAVEPELYEIVSEESSEPSRFHEEGYGVRPELFEEEAGVDIPSSTMEGFSGLPYSESLAPDHTFEEFYALEEGLLSAEGKADEMAGEESELLEGEVGGGNTFHRIANDITGAFEGGKPDTLNLYDRGIISYGKHQATLAAGTMFSVLQRYTDLSSSETGRRLTSYLDRTKRKDESLREDKAFIQLLKEAARDPAMSQAQDEMFARLYWVPAKRAAAGTGVKSALGHVVFYDTKVQGGLQQVTDETKKRLGGKVDDLAGGRRITEQEFLRVFVQERINRKLRASARQAAQAVTLREEAEALRRQAATAEPTRAKELLNQAARKQREADRNAANARALETSATKTRGPTFRALVEAGDLALMGDSAGQIRLVGKPGVIIQGLRPGATVDSLSTAPSGAEPSVSTGSSTILSLPQQFRDLVSRGVLTLEVALALLSGDRDANRLTDRVFYARHPARNPKRGGTPIQPHERQLVEEWLQIRDRLIRPALQMIARG